MMREMSFRRKAANAFRRSGMHSAHSRERSYPGPCTTAGSPFSRGRADDSSKRCGAYSVGSAIRRNHANVTRLHQRNARIARASGIEIRPRLFAAFGTQRTDVGAIALGADDRREAPTCGDKLGKATNKDAAIAEMATA
jgi:hypothetical protein